MIIFDCLAARLGEVTVETDAQQLQNLRHPTPTAETRPLRGPTERNSSCKVSAPAIYQELLQWKDLLEIFKKKQFQYHLGYLHVSGDLVGVLETSRLLVDEFLKLLLGKVVHFHGEIEGLLCYRLHPNTPERILTKNFNLSVGNQNPTAAIKNLVGRWKAKSRFVQQRGSRPDRDRPSVRHCIHFLQQTAVLAFQQLWHQSGLIIIYLNIFQLGAQSKIEL